MKSPKFITQFFIYQKAKEKKNVRNISLNFTSLVL